MSIYTNHRAQYQWMRPKSVHIFFISKPIFELSLELLSKFPKWGSKLLWRCLVFLESRLKVAKFFDNFRLKCMENKQKLTKLTKVAQNFWLEAKKLLRIKSEAKGVQNGVAYKKKCVYTLNDLQIICPYWPILNNHGVQSQSIGLKSVGYKKIHWILHSNH